MMQDVAASPALEQRQDAAEATAAAEAELRRALLGLLRAEWATLAVVSLGGGTHAVEATAALVRAARGHRLGPVRSIDGTGGAKGTDELLAALAATDAGDVRTALALDDPSERPDRMAALLAVDAVLLVVRLGASTFEAVRAVVELAGRDRVLGCLVVPR